MAIVPGPETNWRWVAIKTCLVVGGLIALTGVMGEHTTSREAPPLRHVSEARAADGPASPWLSPAGRIWTGVILWYGEGDTKMRVGEVLGGNDDYVDPITGQQFRGIKLRMASGKAEWKNRDAIIDGGWYVRADDPAIARQEWNVYRF